MDNRNRQEEKIKTVWNEPFDVQNLESHVDPRGFLFEILRFKDQFVPGEGQLYTFSIEPGKRRGDHYHLKKKEWFTCVYGEAIVLLSHKEKTKAIKISAEHPKIIYAGSQTAHALLNVSNNIAVIVSYGSKQHNPEDEDTYRSIAYKDFEIIDIE